MSLPFNTIPTATIGQSTTCLACGIRLPSLETQQLHHKSDWHTYNLKRKMVGLPPVGSDVFSQLVTASREQANPAQVDQPECIPCGKKYLSFQAYDNHVNSKKHKQAVLAHAKKEQGSDGSAPSSPPSSPLGKQLDPSDKVCFFCSHAATDALENYTHMKSQHGFFLPSSERLIDLEGMLTYLAEKLVQDFDCLWCTPSVFRQNLQPDQELNAGFSNLASVRRHMLDKGHCKLAMDQGAEREYADFYLPLEDLDSDQEEEAKQSQENSSMDLDEDQQKLHTVLVDDQGNWILDAQANGSGIQVDPLTNELVLNHRRLAHKDAVRRQKVDSRTVTLRPSQRRPSHPDDHADSNDPAPAQDGEEQDTLLGTDHHHADVKVSTELLKSQNQLSGSVMAVTKNQLKQVALLNAKAQDFESTKRAKMVNKIAKKANDVGRLRYDSGNNRDS